MIKLGNSKLIREYHEDIIESIPSTIIITDNNLKIQYANKNFYLKSRKREIEVMGERLEKVFPASHSMMNKLKENIKNVIKNGIPFTDGHMWYHGKFYFYKIRPLKEADGSRSIIKAMLLMEDVTELTRLEEKLRDSYTKLENAFAELKESSDIKSEFLTTVSHELRTPLTVINTYLELFENAKLGELNEAQQEKLKILRTQTSNMMEIVDDILDTSRLETKKFKLNRYPVKLENIAKRVIEELSKLAELKEHTLTLKIHSNLPNIIGDGERIRQVFNNLLSNAIRYTPNKGKIEIEIKNEDDHILTIVSDTGVGIPKHEIKKIFEKFYIGGGQSLSREAGRLGLGLSITKGVIEAHGGKIWVESTPGKGSRFYFTIPKVENKNVEDS